MLILIKYKINKSILCLLAFLFFLLMADQAHAKLRIAYVENGNYIDHNLILQETVKWLGNIGIIENERAKLPISATNKELWQWLAQNAGGDKVEFVADAFYSANWNSTLLRNKIKELRNRIITNDDIDLVFTFGTNVGVTISRRIPQVNVMNFTMTDPSLEQIKSVGENMFSKDVPSRDLQQIDLFQQIFDFKSLGICYEDSAAGRQEINYEQIIQASQLYNFALVEGKIDDFNDDLEANINSLKQCYTNLASKVEAIYLTSNIDTTLGNSIHFLPEILKPLIDHKIPSFAQNGKQDVAYGALLGIVPASFDDLGYFEAGILRQIINGKKPNDIDKIYDGELNLAINLDMAKQIEWAVPLEILSNTEKVYFQFQ